MFGMLRGQRDGAPTPPSGIFGSALKRLYDPGQSVTLSGSAITAWLDTVDPTHNNMGDAGGTARPTLVSNGIGGKPLVRVAKASSQFQVEVTGANVVVQPLTLFGVAQFKDALTATPAFMFGSLSNNLALSAYSPAGVPSIQLSAAGGILAVDVAVDPTAAFWFIAVFDSASSSLDANDVSVNNANGGTLGLDRVLIGANPPFNAFSSVDIGLLGVASTNPTTTQRAQLRDYLKTRWQL